MSELNGRYTQFNELVEGGREAVLSVLGPDMCEKKDVLLEELVLALGVLGSVLLEGLVLDQAHVGTEIS